MTNIKPLLLSLFIIFSACKRTVGERNSPAQTSLGENIIRNEAENDENEDLPSRKIALKGKITRIVYGDTAELLYNGEFPLMIRFQHIDAPEKRGNQPYGNKAKTVLSDLCFGQQVTLITDAEFDMGGRIIGVLINEEGINVNKEMVRLGYAWHFKKYSEDQSYEKLEKEARIKKRGLWQESNPVAPWDFR
jgi:endonuclease YncB( thermonuclease family)